MNLDESADRRIFDAFHQTPASIARAKAIQRAERIAAGVDVETGRPFPLAPPMVICSGWIEPRHEPIVLKDGDPTRISHGMCQHCSDALEAQMPGGPR